MPILYYFLIVGVSFIVCFFFAGALGKEMREMGIVDVSPNIVSIPGLIKYIRKKRELNQSLSFQFYGAVISCVMIFAPFIALMIIY